LLSVLILELVLLYPKFWDIIFPFHLSSLPFLFNFFIYSLVFQGHDACSLIFIYLKFLLIPGIGEDGIKEVEGMNSSMIYCKNFCNVAVYTHPAQQQQQKVSLIVGTLFYLSHLQPLVTTTSMRLPFYFIFIF
jgi:hypothetical protein